MRDPNGYCLFKISNIDDFGGTPTDLQIFNNESRAITASTFGKLQLWDYGSSDLYPTQVIDNAHADSILGISLNPNSNGSLVSCSRDKSVLMWDLKEFSSTSIGIYENHDCAIRVVVFGAENETGGAILVGDNNGSIFAFDPRVPQKIIFKFKAGNRPIRKIKFNK